MINQNSKSYPLKKIWCLSMTPYYNTYTQRYTNIVTLDKEPIGPLSDIVRKIYPPRLSDFQRVGYNYDSINNSHSHCLYAIQNIDNTNPNPNHFYGNKMNLLTIDCISDLYSFLISNNYDIDFKLTKLMQNPHLKDNNQSRPLTTICYISYLYYE